MTPHTSRQALIAFSFVFCLGSGFRALPWLEICFTGFIEASVFGACSSSSDQKWSYFLFGFLSEAVVTNRKTRAHMDVYFWIIEFLWMSIGQILLHHRCDGCFL
jgi:hypothetical protein